MNDITSMDAVNRSLPLSTLVSLTRTNRSSTSFKSTCLRSREAKPVRVGEAIPIVGSARLVSMVIRRT